MQRVWLVPDQRAIPTALLAEHPDLVVARVDAAALSALPEGADRIYLIDRNNHVAYKSKPGPFGFKPDDLEKALKKITGSS